MNVVAALVLKQLMEQQKIPGTLRLYPGVAEELLATKAYFVRAGLFKDVDLVLGAHVGSELATSWGQWGTGLVSVQYSFHGKAAHAAGAPWSGRSALDGVELMNIGWNYRREHLPLDAALALRGGERRRPAERGALGGQRLVLLPRARLPEGSRTSSSSATPWPRRGRR